MDLEETIIIFEDFISEQLSCDEIINSRVMGNRRVDASFFAKFLPLLFYFNCRFGSIGEEEHD